MRKIYNKKERVGDMSITLSRRVLRLGVAIAGAALLVACGDPEKSAEKALIAAQADWTDARKSLDPEKRVDAYEDVPLMSKASVKNTRNAARPTAVAAGAAGGVAIADMKREHARLAERASCYAKPTVECLEPFASSGYQYQAANAGSAGNANAGGGAARLRERFRRRRKRRSKISALIGRPMRQASFRSRWPRTSAIRRTL